MFLILSGDAVAWRNHHRHDSEQIFAEVVLPGPIRGVPE
jgi:hypothetical protein